MHMSGTAWDRLRSKQATPLPPGYSSGKLSTLRWEFIKENKKVGKQENKKTKTRTNQLNKLNNDFIKLKRAYPSLIYLRR